MENRNFILFVALSIAVMILWTEFIVPKPDPVATETAQTQTQAGEGTIAPEPSDRLSLDSRAPALTEDGTTKLRSRAEALEDPRIFFEGQGIKGSISLKGARIDDVTLKNYRETIDKTSDQIILFSPERTEDAYYADYGWAATRSDVRVPDSNSVWTPVHPGRLTPQTPVEITWNNGQGLTFRRIISMDDNFMFDVRQIVENNSDKPVELFPWGRISRFGLPDLANFFILHEGFIGVFDRELSEEDYDDVAKDGDVKLSSTGGWLGITDKYWLAALAPKQDQTFEGSYQVRKAGGADRYNASFIVEGVRVAPGGRSELSSNLFVGAKKKRTLAAYQTDLGITRFDNAIDWGLFFFITKPIFQALDYFGHLIGNFGIAILMVTVLIKLLLFPMANKAYASMSKMKKLQPELLSLRERFADDRMKQQQEMMELYKREQVNPLAGCLPMLIQIPVFFALYKVIFISIDVRQAPFFGWVQDLSLPDPTSILNLFGLLPWDGNAIPLIGNILGIGVWPLVMGVTMFVQMKLNPAPQDPIQEKMFTLMPIVFTFMLAQFPAALVIYWAWNNTLSIGQQYYIMRKNGVEVELVKNMGLQRFFAKGADSKDEA